MIQLTNVLQPWTLGKILEDKNPDDPLAASRFIQITKAYQALTEPWIDVCFLLGLTNGWYQQVRGWDFF